MADDLKGSDFRAVRRLSNGADETLAEAGDTCAQVPVESLPGLLAHGYIEPIDPPAATSAPDPESPRPAPADEQPF